MKKLFFLFLLMPTLMHTSPACTTLFTTNKHGQKKTNTKLTVACSCECKGPRTQNNTCFQCGHKKMLNPLHGLSIQESEHHKKNKYAIDLVTTFSGATH